MEARGWRREAIAGVTTFFTMSYIVVVNPSILSSQGTGMPFDGVLTATVVICFLMTLAMGLYAKLPFAVAPGMGLNAFFAYSIVLSRHVPWQVALGMVFWSGVLFVLISVGPVREWVANAIPLQLRIAAAGGIGLFLTFIGLRNAGLIAPDPATLLRPGPLGWETLLACLGLLVSAYLIRRGSPLAFLAGMAAVTLLAVSLGLVYLPDSWLSLPDFSRVFLQLDPVGALQWALAPAIISLLFTDLFDSLSTFVGVSQANGMLDENGQPRNLRQGLLVDAFATLGAGLAGSSPGTAYIESSAGIQVGGRSGLTSVFTALCFLPCLFLAPLAAMVPPFATAPVLVLVGLYMFRGVRDLSLEKLEDALPAFLTLILIPLTFSITQGILWGFIAHVALYIQAGRWKDLRPAMVALAVLAAVLILIDNTQRG